MPLDKGKKITTGPLISCDDSTNSSSSMKRSDGIKKVALVRSFREKYPLLLIIIIKSTTRQHHETHQKSSNQPVSACFGVQATLLNAQVGRKWLCYSKGESKAAPRSTKTTKT